MELSEEDKKDKNSFRKSEKPEAATSGFSCSSE